MGRPGSGFHSARDGLYNVQQRNNVRASAAKEWQQFTCQLKALFENSVSRNWRVCTVVIGSTEPKQVFIKHCICNKF